MREAALGAWFCGDPGLQFDDTINAWHTCPASGRIRASNPCSEYMHLDDSACNLASINLLKFLKSDGSLDLALLRHVVQVMIAAQDILVDRAGYPSPKIAQTAHDFRQLGLGVANLGALLMSLGLPYDSLEGRDLAAGLTAVVCGEAYRVSALLAAKLAPFAGYGPNAEAMLTVIERHKRAAHRLASSSAPQKLREESEQVWTDALELGRRSGFRNSQTTVLAPTGTIAFLMDCDTTGIEPDIGLIKYKRLSGGGSLMIVNNCVPRALKRLGYRPEQSARILSYIQEHGRIEGAPDLDSSHLAVFDCAFAPEGGARSISVDGHLQMMAALQPFVSGAISKTVNVPESASVEDIYQAFIAAWELGLKAVAVYRDNSRRSQPLALREHGTAGAHRLTSRRHLPDERQSITHKFSIAGHEGYLTVGLYEDGKPGEIFIVMSKEGSTISGVMDAFATSISLALQYGVPLAALVKKFSHMRFDPAGITNNREIPFASSVMDYIFRWLALKFLTPLEQSELGLAAASATAAPQITMAAPPCPTCGSLTMIRQGNCWLCRVCGSNTGCG